MFQSPAPPASAASVDRLAAHMRYLVKTLERAADAREDTEEEGLVHVNMLSRVAEPAGPAQPHDNPKTELEKCELRLQEVAGELQDLMPQELGPTLKIVTGPLKFIAPHLAERLSGRFDAMCVCHLVDIELPATLCRQVLDREAPRARELERA